MIRRRLSSFMVKAAERLAKAGGSAPEIERIPRRQSEISK